MQGGKETGMVHWLGVEARDRGIRVRFPAPVIISDFGPSQVFAEQGQRYRRSTVCLHTPHLQIVSNSGRHGYRGRLEYYSTAVL